MHAFTVHPQKKPAPVPAEQPRRRWRRWFAALVLLLAIGGLVWAVRPDPHLARVQELQKELFSPEAKNLSPDDRKAKFTELREQMKHLSDDQKWELGAPMREKQKAEMDRYFALSPKEKAKYLDERIDASEKMRKEFEKKAASAGKTGGGFGASGGTKGGTPRSTQDIAQRRKQMLDRTAPEERARMDVFRKEMNDRRKQRGLLVR